MWCFINLFSTILYMLQNCLISDSSELLPVKCILVKSFEFSRVDRPYWVDNGNIRRSSRAVKILFLPNILILFQVFQLTILLWIADLTRFINRAFSRCEVFGTLIWTNFAYFEWLNSVLKIFNKGGRERQNALQTWFHCLSCPS